MSISLITCEDIISFVERDMSDEEMHSLIPYCEAIGVLSLPDLLVQLVTEFDEQAQDYVARCILEGSLNLDCLVLLLADAAKRKSEHFV